MHSASDHGYVPPPPRCIACGSQEYPCCDGEGNLVKIVDLKDRREVWVYWGKSHSARYVVTLDDDEPCYPRIQGIYTRGPRGEQHRRILNHITKRNVARMEMALGYLSNTPRS